MAVDDLLKDKEKLKEREYLNYLITRKDIEKKLRAVEPEEGRAKYFIDIGGKNYPIKQTLSQTLNLPGVAFSSHQAFAILQKLGFKIIKRN